MSSGYCDSNWAKEHHDLWYEEVADQAEPYPPTTAPRAASAAGEQAASGV
jgi:formate dehydrogenase subunit gamma